MHYHVIRGDFPLDPEGKPTDEAAMQEYLEEWFPVVRQAYLENNKQQTNVSNLS